MQPSATGQVITVLVDDVATTLNQAADLGGEILQGPSEVPGGGGIFGYLKDPCGNRIGVWMRPPG
jgi:predicted enzyme related to lactoylglutathione lyase